VDGTRAREKLARSGRALAATPASLTFVRRPLASLGAAPRPSPRRLASPRLAAASRRPASARRSTRAPPSSSPPTRRTAVGSTRSGLAELAEQRRTVELVIARLIKRERAIVELPAADGASLADKGERLVALRAGAEA
jgi:hypothetical protein